jgi:hypothetical protein
VPGKRLQALACDFHDVGEFRGRYTVFLKAGKVKMRIAAGMVAAFCLLVGVARAGDERAGDFDYYVMALS